MVVGSVAEITAVSPVFAAVLIHLFDAVIDPFPDESALQPVIFVKGGKVIFQAAVAVAHGMGKFAHDQGTTVFGVLRPFNDSVHGRIHRANDIGKMQLVIP